MWGPRRGAAALPGNRCWGRGGADDTSLTPRPQLWGPHLQRDGTLGSGVLAAARPVLAVFLLTEKQRPCCWGVSGLSPWAPGPLSPESGPGARAPLGDTAASPMSLGGSARGSRLPQPRDRPSPGTRGSWAPAPSLLHRSEWTRPGGGSFSLSRAADARGPVHPCCTEAGAGLRTRVAVRVRAASA